MSGRNATTNDPFGSAFATRSAPGNAAAARAAGENSFLLHEAPRPDETFLVVHLDDVIDNLEIHGGRENVLADAFDDVRFGLADFFPSSRIRSTAIRSDRRR